MARLSMFFYAEDSQMVKQGIVPDGQMNPNAQLIVTQPMHTLIPQFTPCMYSFCVVFGVLDVDTSIQHKVQYIFRDPDGLTVLDTGNQVFQPYAKEEMPDHMMGFVSNLQFRNAPFKKDGIYESEVIVDGESLGKIELPVQGRERL